MILCQFFYRCINLKTTLKKNYQRNLDNVITTGVDVEVPVTFNFGNVSFTRLYVSNIITVYPWCLNASPHTPSICFKVCMIVQTNLCM